jgi:hypothetical protein
MASLGERTDYNPEVLYGSRDGSPSGKIEQPTPNAAMVVDTLPEGSDSYVTLLSHEEARKSAQRFVGVNVRYMFYVAEKDTRFLPEPDYVEVASAAHPQAFPPMMFEGHRPCERRRLAQRGYAMRIFSSHREIQVAKR